MSPTPAPPVVRARPGFSRSLSSAISLPSVLLTTKMVIDGPEKGNPTDVIFVPNKPPPPPPPPTDETVQHKTVHETLVTQPPTNIEIPPLGTTILGTTGVDDHPIVEFGSESGPIALDPPKHAKVRHAARFDTPDRLLRPPNPLSKIRTEEEASLRLRLSIDARGYVIAVDPVEAADPDFLAAARKHLLKAWRYKPATEDGVGVASTVVITLSFRLEDG